MRSAQPRLERTQTRSLEALEEERFEALPPRPYVRTFVVTYARELGIREADLLAASYANPFRQDRLEEQPDGRLALRLKTRWRDGTTHVLMERSELIDRFVPLIPPPRAHQVRYHGILAPCASHRSQVVPATPFGTEPVARVPEATAQGTASVTNGRPTPPTSDARGTREPDPAEPCGISPADACPRRTRWAALLQRVFDIDALRCPRCGSTLRLLAAIEDPAIARRILECIGLPARAPPTLVAPSSDGPFESASHDAEHEDFDQAPSHEEP